ncbi:suppressor of RPS4-RLD 1 isoform X1 [Tripterygium wilfordii]|uniref:Suppressor of RPS4-RLD 1 isoform X1 n=1 Tax=Tripterygium wilfordii TaxID=458696 RepID=A0A7J7CQ70_TRIWF|nr:suppressor of RPS4-RLD 1-like [Tripterygium wilfordii]KAF5736201.1 suppressor of RPS4-RLD 1 isoform X1 [Tripterygium wilfordii]
MASATSQRVELAKLCRSRDWSKAIRVLDSILAQSSSIQDICNRAFCYSRLELHKHVIKDCDRAVQLDPTLLQPYILKGHALSALGRKADAILVWEKGYEHALSQSADLKQLLELEELLTNVKEERNVSCNNVMVISRSSKPLSEAEPYISDKHAETCVSQSERSHSSNLCSESSNQHEIHVKSSNSFEVNSGINDKVAGILSVPPCEPDHLINDKSSDIHMDHTKLNGESRYYSKLGDTSVMIGNSGNEFDIGDGFGDKSEENGIFESQQNGTCDILDKLNYDSGSCNDLSNTSEACATSSIICCNLGDESETRGESSNKDIHIKARDEPKRNSKFSVTRISKTKSISVDFRLSRGIAQVNEGKYAQAISIFDQILREDPIYPEALIGRGTAYAFQRELEAAIVDFTMAIKSNPSAGEAWKRRGQARAALGEFSEAIEDLTKALEFEPNSADILHERGIVNFKFKDFNAAVKDLSACVKLDKNNSSAYTYSGSALSSIGDYKRAEEALWKSIELDRGFVEGWVHRAQFFQDLANSTKALECLQQVLQIDERFAKAYHMRGALFHGMGEHRKAIKELSIGLRIESSNIECMYLRASCHHAIGEYGQAVKDYDTTLELELDSMDKFPLQCLAFYQKEIALYTASRINSEFCWFDIDRDINPLFKEYWCKRLHPNNVCEKVYRQPPLRESQKKGNLRKLDFTMTKQKSALLLAADSIGKKIQYDCPGFLHNRRQHRMAGLAAIEIAQKVSKAWRSLQAERKNANKSTSKYGKRTRRKERLSIASQNRGGACCSTSSSLETSTSYGITESSGRSMMSWQDVFSLAVRWRQISEPCDPVVWVNKLSEEFNSGFGSHTPLILGQAKVVRYFPNYERILDIAKTIMKDKRYVHNKADGIIDLSKDEKWEDIMHAKTCSDLYKAVGEDFWLATCCSSTAFEGKQLEGTRITLVKMRECGFDFAIRTPCTPSRWDDYDAEMAMAWDAVCNAYCGETYGSTDFSMLEDVRDAILKMTYYWYNFMPLSRGSAVVGFIVLLGLLLAANMEFTGNIPQGIQVDWEALLNLDPDSFVDSVKSWLYPSLKVSTSWKDYPDVSTTFYTTGSVVAALSTSDN